MKAHTQPETADASQNRASKHTWGKDGFCIYCHNVHRTDGNARSTCSDGFTCRAPAQPENNANYRVALKRVIRHASGTGDEINDLALADLESLVKTLAKNIPARVASALDFQFEAAAKAWERGNNSGNPRVLTEENNRCERLRDRAEKVMALFGIKTEYPGLYPIFVVPGRFNNCTWYSTKSVLEALYREENTLMG